MDDYSIYSYAEWRLIQFCLLMAFEYFIFAMMMPVDMKVVRANGDNK